MITALGIICLIIALVLWRYANRALQHNRLDLQKRSKQPHIAILIPARYESAVIQGLLESIAKQTFAINMQDVYVIVESLGDPTVNICQRFNANIILRQHLDRQRKGYALDEAIQQILATKKHYDLYFIFDADNRLSPTYIEEMLKIYATGYQMATGYRHAKNNNRNVIAAVSALTFTMINTLGNKNRIRHAANIIFSGTGCYIDGELIEKWQGWPFHSLTEDYEMSLYAILHNISTFYNEKAVFYDEQPTSYRQTVEQRIRWIKGYFSARQHYIPLMRKRQPASNQGSVIKETVGVTPIIWVVAGAGFLMLDDLISLITNRNYDTMLFLFLSLIILIYITLMIATVIMIRKEKMHFKPSIKIKTVLFNPIYLLTYIPCALKAILTKNVRWTRIEHGRHKK